MGIQKEYNESEEKYKDILVMSSRNSILLSAMGESTRPVKRGLKHGGQNGKNELRGMIFWLMEIICNW